LEIQNVADSTRTWRF